MNLPRVGDRIEYGGREFEYIGTVKGNEGDLLVFKSDTHTLTYHPIYYFKDIENGKIKLICRDIEAIAKKVMDEHEELFRKLAQDD
jgi:signal peptidase I